VTGYVVHWQVLMPALSSTMTEGKVVQWTAKVGDKIKAGQTVMVVESDKVSPGPVAPLHTPLMICGPSQRRKRSVHAIKIIEPSP
jgi:hypothetical protein